MAYGAVVYLRIATADNNYYTLVMSKNRLTLVRNKMQHAIEIRNNSNIQDWPFIPTELNVADNCNRVIIQTNKHQWILGPIIIYFSKMST